MPERNPIPITGLPVAIGLTGTEWIPLSQSGVTKRVTSNLLVTNGEGREVLTANRSYYVRSDGNNGNTGLENTAGGAWATPQYAANYIGSYIDFAGFRVTVNVAAGTYAGIYNRPYVGGGALYWKGDINTPSNVILGNATNPSGFTIGSFNLLERTATGVWFNGFRFAPTAGPCIDADPASCGDGVLTFGDLEDFLTAKIELAGNGSGGAVILGNFLDFGNTILLAGASLTSPTAYLNTLTKTAPFLASTLTITGTPAFSTAFIVVNADCLLQDFHTYSGSATGLRYKIRQGGVMVSVSPDSGPGDTAGVVEPGGLLSYTGADGVFIGTTREGSHNVVLSGGATQLTNLQTTKHFENMGATSLTSVTLPNAQADLEYTFLVTDTDGIRVIAKSGDTIRIAGSVSASGGRIDSTTIGDTVCLRGIDTTQWIAKYTTGTWTVT